MRLLLLLVMQIAFGSYVGNATDDRSIAGVGFQPDYVMVRGSTNREAVHRFSTMSGDATLIPHANVSPLITDGIQALEADGFQVGTSVRVNESGVTFYWMAIKAAAGEASVGSYVGNATDNRNITGLGFDPAFVIVQGEARVGVFRTTAHSGDLASRMSAATAIANLIQSLVSGGFQVGSDAQINANTETFHYLAIKAGSQLDSGTYTGDATDDRVIASAIDPVFGLTKGSASAAGALRKTNMPGTTGPLLSPNNWGSHIKALVSGGMQVSSGSFVNNSGTTYYWFAFAAAPPVSVTLVAGHVVAGSATITPSAGATSLADSGRSTTLGPSAQVSAGATPDLVSGQALALSAPATAAAGASAALTASHVVTGSADAAVGYDLPLSPGWARAASGRVRFPWIYGSLVLAVDAQLGAGSVAVNPRLK